MTIIATPKAPSAKKAIANTEPVGNIRFIAVEALERNPFQYRRSGFTDAELQELAASITLHDVLQPILVRPVGGKKHAGVEFQIVAGERRWRASMLAGKTFIPAVVRDLTDLESSEIALVENAQREDPDDWSIAEGLRNYMKMSAEKGAPLSEIGLAKKVGKSEGYVRNHLGLFKLRPALQKVAQRHKGGIKSSLFEIQKIKDVNVERELVQAVETGAPFTSIRDRVARVLAEEKKKSETSKAPDAETQQRASLRADGAGGSMSRGRVMRGTGHTEARREFERHLASSEANAVLLKLWCEKLSEKDQAILAPRLRALRANIARLE